MCKLVALLPAPCTQATLPLKGLKHDVDRFKQAAAFVVSMACWHNPFSGTCPLSEGIIVANPQLT